MIEIQRRPDTVEIQVEDGAVTDAAVEFEEKSDRLTVLLTAKNDRPRFIVMRWRGVIDRPVQIHGDDWERLSGDKCFEGLNADRYHPWYFVMTDGKTVDAAGVAVRPNSFVSFSCDGEGVTAWFDVRCGGTGVSLGGRRLAVADLICRHYDGISVFEAEKRFCRALCSDPILPKEPVYGGNNWYYAYGKSSPAEILSDARLQARLAGDNPVRPFMVIDDCWEILSCCGPWLPKESFGDMKALADGIRAEGVRPGIWVRFLYNQQVFDEHPEYIIKRDGNAMKGLDPSIPAVLDIVKADIARIKSWGFELIKHDFSSCDMFGQFGYTMRGAVANEDRWSFADTSRTSAEIVLDFYRAIREACGDVLVLGCNTFSHLLAGLAEISRVGDDTSGRNTDRTRAFGVNSLAFRLAQHNAFYAVDADCAGFQNNAIPWSFNKQWVDLLAKSGTPLFISCPEGVLTEEEIGCLQDAYRRFVRQEDTVEPLDWTYNAHPRRWLVNGKEETYDWQEKAPAFCYCRTCQTH